MRIKLSTLNNVVEAVKLKRRLRFLEALERQEEAWSLHEGFERLRELGVVLPKDIEKEVEDMLNGR